MPYDLIPEERETHLNMSGDNHDTWEVFSDDPFWQRRLERLGIEPTKIVGSGRHYRLSVDQVLIRKGKRHVSDEQRERMRQNARFGAKNTSGTSDFENASADAVYLDD